MQKKDYYTLKEIILGLRNEYLIHQQKLQELKQFCEMDKRAVDFYFRVFQPKGKRPILLCEYVPKQNNIQKFITDISKKTGYYIYGRQTSRLVTDHNQYYFLSGKTEYPIHIKYDYGMDTKFTNQANCILNSEFSNNIQSQYIEDNRSDINATLAINSNLIELYIRNECRDIPNSIILYDSRDDILEFKSFEGKYNKQCIARALDIEFPSEKLNQYHIQTLANNEESEKTIVLEEFNPCDMAKFDIQVKEKQYVLQKIRK